MIHIRTADNKIQNKYQHFCILLEDKLQLLEALMESNPEEMSFLGFKKKDIFVRKNCISIAFFNKLDNNLTAITEKYNKILENCEIDKNRLIRFSEITSSLQTKLDHRNLLKSLKYIYVYLPHEQEENEILLSYSMIATDILRKEIHWVTGERIIQEDVLLSRQYNEDANNFDYDIGDIVSYKGAPVNNEIYKVKVNDFFVDLKDDHIVVYKVYLNKKSDIFHDRYNKGLFFGTTIDFSELFYDITNGVIIDFNDIYIDQDEYKPDTLSNTKVITTNISAKIPAHKQRLNILIKAIENSWLEGIFEEHGKTTTNLTKEQIFKALLDNRFLENEERRLFSVKPHDFFKNESKAIKEYLVIKSGRRPQNK